MTIAFYKQAMKTSASKKGVSNFLSAALLVLMVVVISTIVSGWLNTLSREETNKIRNTTSEQLGCQFADLFIKNATYNCSGNCAAGTNHNITVAVSNNGKKAVNITTIVIRNTTGTTTSLDIGPVKTINVGEDVMVSNVSTATCTGINGSIDVVMVSSVNCPGNAYDSLPGSSVSFLSC